MKQRLERGLIQVYTGNNKGKTTAALGLALRACGHGFQVYMISFLKGSSYTGELYAAARLSPNLRIVQFGRNCPHASLIKEGFMKCTGCGECFVKSDEITGEDREKIALAFRHASEIILGGDHDIVILDEILNAFKYGLLEVGEVVGLLKGKPEHVEVVLTGRAAPPEIIEMAHLVTEMAGIKHPFKDYGITARRGIEY